MRLTSILNRLTTKRLAKCWILGWAAALGLVAIPSEAAGQITITTKDMFTKEGQYYKNVLELCRAFFRSATGGGGRV